MRGTRYHLARVGSAATVMLLVFAAACGSSSDDGAEATTTSSAAGTTTSSSDDAHTDHEGTTPTSELPPCPEEPTADPHSMAHEGDDHPTESPGEPSRDCALPAPVQAELDPQLAVTRAILAQYPDATTAATGGYEISEGNSHIVNWAYMDDEFDLDHPEMLLLDDENDTDQVVAAVYYVVSDDDAPPDGFVGTRDRWHTHADVCVVPARTDDDGAQIRCDEDEDGETCEVTLQRSGTAGECGPPTLEDGADGWMLHVWEAPGHPSPLGLFSAQA